MNRKLIWTIAIFLLASPYADAQQRAKIHKVAELVFYRPGSTLGTGRQIFRQELGRLGYVEGKNIAYETRSADGKSDRFPALAEELVRLNVDVLLTSSPSELSAAKRATKTIPIFFFAQGDPVASGLADSLARPGSNITGITTFSPDLSGKRLELLKEILPKLSRIAVMWNPKGELSGQSWKETQLAAKELGLQLHSMEVGSAEKLDSAFKEAIKAGSSAIAVTQNSLMSIHQKQIAGLATKNRLPIIFPRADYVASGGLMSYGADQGEAYRHAALIVDRILKGTKPAEIPVERPAKFELIINLKTAKEMGLTIPPNVLARADRVIR